MRTFHNGLTIHGRWEQAFHIGLYYPHAYCIVFGTGEEDLGKPPYTFPIHRDDGNKLEPNHGDYVRKCKVYGVYILHFADYGDFIKSYCSISGGYHDKSDYFCRGKLTYFRLFARYGCYTTG